MSFRRTVFQLVRIFFAAAFFFFSIYTILIVTPWVEQAIWPVVGKLHFLSHSEKVDDDGTIRTTIFVQYEQYRECELLGLSWTRILPDGSLERIPVFQTANDTTLVNRPNGKNTAGPWVLPLPFSEIEGHTFVKVYHRCSPLWVTTTNFYP